MNREDIFLIWSPPSTPWSPWVKPVLFAHLDPRNVGDTGLPPVSLNIPSILEADGTCALVVDLPGQTGVWLGLELAEKGYRPIPLYNGLPTPTLSSGAPVAACDIASIITAIAMATPLLMKVRIAHIAPPAFLLDSKRRMGDSPLTPGMFDNRSVSLPTDFPSAATLLGAGIRRVIMIRETCTTPQEDLSHTLLRWQEAGIAIQAMSLEQPELVSIRVTKPPFYRIIWQRMLALTGLRRSPLGGFGGLLPIPTHGGGGVG